MIRHYCAICNKKQYSKFMYKVYVYICHRLVWLCEKHFKDYCFLSSEVDNSIEKTAINLIQKPE